MCYNNKNKFNIMLSVFERVIVINLFEKSINYNNLMLIELQRLENISNEYRAELKYLSKRIRKDLWADHNTEQLYTLLNKMNNIYERMIDFLEYFDLSWIFEYVKILQKYCRRICPTLDDFYYSKLIGEIQLENARVIVEQQWQDIYASEDGLKSFKKIFDDVFSNCIENNKDKFFYRLKETDCLCRVVNDKYEINKERFIPWKSNTNNRWNPPGRAFLYLSFSHSNKEYSSELSVNEYICLEEYRAEKGNTYYFCDFKPVKEGLIFDLSYNDISLDEIKHIVDDHYNDIVANIYGEIVSDPNAILKYHKNRKKLAKRIHKLQDKYIINKKILEESFAKQYLKMICSCIYKKVDETDEVKREQAYRSFHALALYLEEKGVTGIIYPCTRTKKVIGKNLVLFNKDDAEPIESSIRQFIFATEI